MPRWRRLATVAVVSAVSFGVRPSPSVIDAQQPVYRSAVDLVEVDVIVKGRDGRFVRDLRLDEIEVLENGRPQPLQAFYLVDGGTATGLPASASATGFRQAVPVRRAYFLLFDQEHLTPGSLNRVRAGAEQFLARDFRDGRDLAALHAIGAKGQVRMTMSREELLRAVREVKPRGDVAARLADLRDWPRVASEVEARRIDHGDQTVLNGAIARACADEPRPNCAEQADALLREKAKRFVRDAESAINRTLQALAAAANGLSRLEGRKTLVFMTDGFAADGQRAALQQVTGAAGRAGVAIYVIDARGLDKAGAWQGMPEAAPADTLAADAFDTREDPGDQLANGTGGLVVRNVNDGAKAIAAIAEDSSTYYIVGYIPEDRALDGRFRTIQVRVKREGMVVRARRGYAATPRSAPLIAAAPADASGAGATRDAQAAPPPPLLSSTALTSVAALAPSRPHARARVSELMAAREGTELRAAPSAPANEAATRGWARYEAGDLEGAAIELSKAAALPGAPVWARYALGQASFGLRKFAEAVASWEEVRRAVPEFEPVYFDLVDGYLQLDRAADAIAVLRAAERRWPGDSEVYNALGVIQVRRGSIDDAIESFRKAVKAQPESPLAYFNLGRAHEMRFVRSRRYLPTTGGWIASADDRRDAIANYRKYLQLGGPFAGSARDGLARLEWTRR